RVRSKVEARRDLHPRRRLVEQIAAGAQIDDGPRGIVWRLLREQHGRAFDEAALRQSLRADTGRREHQQKEKRLHGRRMACNVKASSSSGRLYWTFSSVRRVRLPRVRSSISNCRAVQMPWIFWRSE